MEKIDHNMKNPCEKNRLPRPGGLLGTPPAFENDPPPGPRPNGVLRVQTGAVREEVTHDDPILKPHPPPHLCKKCGLV